jgi:hypothetical protein
MAPINIHTSSPRSPDSRSAPWHGGGERRCRRGCAAIGAAKRSHKDAHRATMPAPDATQTDVAIQTEAALGDFGARARPGPAGPSLAGLGVGPCSRCSAGHRNGRAKPQAGTGLPHRADPGGGRRLRLDAIRSVSVLVSLTTARHGSPSFDAKTNPGQERCRSTANTPAQTWKSRDGASPRCEDHVA